MCFGFRSLVNVQDLFTLAIPGREYHNVAGLSRRLRIQRRQWIPSAAEWIFLGLEQRSNGIRIAEIADAATGERIP